jgi:hypothetical protein
MYKLAIYWTNVIILYLYDARSIFFFGISPLVPRGRGAPSNSESGHGVRLAKNCFHQEPNLGSPIRSVPMGSSLTTWAQCMLRAFIWMGVLRKKGITKMERDNDYSTMIRKTDKFPKMTKCMEGWVAPSQ